MHQVDDAIERMECALTITQFCMIENISKATYYKIRRAGLGPVETCAPLPGMNLVRISPEARRAWHAKLQADHSRKTVELERARKRPQQVIVGKRSAKSPLHQANRRAARRSKRK